MINDINNTNAESSYVEHYSQEQRETMLKENEYVIHLIKDGKLIIRDNDFDGVARYSFDSNSIEGCSPEKLEEELWGGVNMKIDNLGTIVEFFQKYGEHVSSMDFHGISFTLNLTNVTPETAFNIRSSLEKMALNGFDYHKPEDNPKITRTENGYTIKGIFD